MFYQLHDCRFAFTDVNEHCGNTVLSTLTKCQNNAKIRTALASCQRWQQYSAMYIQHQQKTSRKLQQHAFKVLFMFCELQSTVQYQKL